LRDIGLKLPILTYLTRIWRPRWGDPVGISLTHLALFPWQ